LLKYPSSTNSPRFKKNLNEKSDFTLTNNPFKNKAF
jgi:hypothetical protein